jgi:hypothetical protein
MKKEESESADKAAIPPLPPNKTATDVFADFLTYLFACAKNYIKQNDPNGVAVWTTVQTDAEFVLSHPNGWGGAQQQQMREAAVQAGLVPDRDSGNARIRFVTEGEASLHYCIQNGLASYVRDVSGCSLPGSSLFNYFSARRWPYHR